MPIVRSQKRRNLARMGWSSRLDRTPPGTATMTTSTKASSPYSNTSSKGTRSTWRVCRRAASLTRTTGPMSGERGKNHDRSPQVVAPLLPYPSSCQPTFERPSQSSPLNVMLGLRTNRCFVCSVGALLQYLLHCRSQVQADRHRIHEAALQGMLRVPGTVVSNAFSTYHQPARCQTCMFDATSQSRIEVPARETSWVV